MATRDEFATHSTPDPIVPAVRALPPPSPLDQSTIRRPAISAEPQVPRSLGTRAGIQARQNVDTGLGVVEATANQSIRPARQLGGVVRDAYKGFTGSPNPNEGKPLAAHFDLPRLRRGLPSSQPPTDFSNVTARVVQGGGRVPLGPARVASSATATTPSDTLPNGVQRTTDDAGNPVYTGTGITTPKVPIRTLPQQVAAPRNYALDALDVARTSQRDIGNNAVGASAQIGASVLNGLSPQSELMRRFEISQGSFKGSPQARRMAGEAILGTIGQMNGLTAGGVAQANQAVLAGQDDQVAANENYAGRRFDASRFNVDTNEARDARDAVGTSFNRTLDAEDGTTSVLANDGTLTALRNPDGTPFRQLPDPSRRTTVSPDAEFKALSEELTSLLELPSQGSTTRASQIQARMAELTGRAPPASRPTMPAIGAIQGGYRFKGGDPSNPASWEKAA